MIVHESLAAVAMTTWRPVAVAVVVAIARELAGPTPLEGVVFVVAVVLPSSSSQCRFYA